MKTLSGIKSMNTLSGYLITKSKLDMEQFIGREIEYLPKSYDKGIRTELTVLNNSGEEPTYKFRIDDVDFEVLTDLKKFKDKFKLVIKLNPSDNNIKSNKTSI